MSGRAARESELGGSGAAAAPPSARAPQPYRNGDIIFHESNSDQSELVRIVTRSRWTHLGVIWNESQGLVVYEAAAPVKATPLHHWIARGRDGEFVVKRWLRSEAPDAAASPSTASPVAASLQGAPRTGESPEGASPEGASWGLAPSEEKKMRGLFQAWLGRPYDYRFQWGDESLYCSEFVYKAFERAAGVPVGKIERAGDMALDEPIIQLAIKSYWGKSKYDPNEPVVTPDSIFRDERLVVVEPARAEAR